VRAADANHVERRAPEEAGHAAGRLVERCELRPATCRQRRSNHGVIDAVAECEEDARLAAAHRCPRSERRTPIGETPSNRVSRVTRSGGEDSAPAPGLSPSQTLPYSDENARSAACLSLSLTSTFVVEVPMPPAFAAI